jgi:hypothetical protein
MKGSLVEFCLKYCIMFVFLFFLLGIALESFSNNCTHFNYIKCSPEDEKNLHISSSAILLVFMLGYTYLVNGRTKKSIPLNAGVEMFRL